MREIFAAFLLSLVVAFAQGQTEKKIPPDYSYVHQGLHMEFGVGPAFGKIDDIVTRNGGDA